MILMNISQIWIIILIVNFLNNSVNAQVLNYISTGDMESEGWTAVSGNTDMECSYIAREGVNGSSALKTMTTNMGGAAYYILRCEESFHLNEFEKVTISFRAKASLAEMRLQAWVQEADEFQWMNFGDAFLTTEWKLYSFTAVLRTRTSDKYQVKFRGYNAGNLHIDDVQIGPGEFGDIPQSEIYEVSIYQNDTTKSLNVFRHACPVYSPGYQGMESKDQKPLGLFAGRTINWAKFSVNDPVIVQVKVIDTNKVPVSGNTVRILPSRYGINSTTNGNIITFTITEPAQYSIEIGENGYKNGLILFADPPETDIPMKNNTAYLILDSASVEDVSSIPLNYSGIYFEKGIHDIGVFQIPGNIKNIYFEDGSWVYGSLIMDGKPDVKIFGRGVLSSARLNYRQSHCVEAINGSHRITIEGLVVADPKYFAVRLIGQYNTVNYTKVIGGWVYNCDGIAAYMGSKVSKCFIWANDDAIKVYRDSITWSDIVVWVLENGAVIQTSWGGAVGGSTSKGIKLSRIDVLRAEWDKPGFNCALLNCVGNRYQEPGRSDFLQNWLIEDVVTENPIPVIFNITPDVYSHTHIHGMILRNWDVKMPMNTSFINEIKGEDPADYLKGFVFDSVVFNDKLLTDINFISKGDMENGGWEGEPGTTNQVVNLEAGIGVDGTMGLKSVVTNMGGDEYYMIKCRENFKLSQANEITISFMAKANIIQTRLDPGIMGIENSTWHNFENIILSTDWKRYTCTTSTLPDTSDIYQLKFRAYGLNTVIYLDDVKIGPPDWLTITAMQTRYLEPPVFLPEYINPFTSVQEHETVPKSPMIYPNPVDDILVISGNDTGSVFNIYSLTGNIMISGRGNTINVSVLKEGFYVLVTGRGDKLKFIKK